MKKLYLLIFVLIGIFGLFLCLYISAKSYEKEYIINSVKIQEKYDKNSKLYSFSIALNDYTFYFVSNAKYSTNRGLISEIKEIKLDQGICIVPISSVIDTYPLCYENNEYLDYRLISDSTKLDEYMNYIDSVEDSYANVDIHYIDNDTYLLWTYKSIVVINNNEKKEIKVFDTDVYNLDLAVVINDYLVIADYEQKFNFNKMYLVDLKKLSIEEWDLDNEISFDSYILGVEDQSVYLVDNKNEIEYELVPHKKKMRKIGTINKKGKILVNGTWDDISINKLISNKETFTYNNDYMYEIKDKYLYLTYNQNISVRISDQVVTRIINVTDDKVYYLVKDCLYLFSIKTGEVKALEYFEWNFNNENVIFIHSS